MNPRKRIFALASLGLLLAAFMAYFCLAARRGGGLPIGFTAFGGLLVLLLAALFALRGKVFGAGSFETRVSDDKRILALVALRLLVAAFLAPFCFAAIGREDLATGFGAAAGLLALLFGALSWSDRIGRMVTIALLAIVVVGGLNWALRSSVTVWHAPTPPAAATVEPGPSSGAPAGRSATEGEHLR